MKTPSDRITEIERNTNALVIKALSLKLALSKADFREADHPRADDGKFGSGSGNGKKEDGEESESGESDPSEDSPVGGSIEANGKKITIHEDEYVKEAYKRDTGSELEFDGQTGIDVRYNNSTSDPMSDYGHAMLVNADKEHRVTGYGKTRWVYDRSSGTDIEDLKEEFVQKWDDAMESGGIFAENGTLYDDTPAEKMWESVNPKDIVDAAEFWDDGKLMQWFYENIADPNGVGAINTQDGSIVWDKDLLVNVGDSIK